MPEKQKPSLTREALAREVSYLLDMPFKTYRKGYKGPAYKVVETVLQVVIDALAQGESVFIPGFGTFKWHERPAMRRIIHYSYDGKPATKNSPKVTSSLPRKRRVIFQPSKVLIRIINDNMP